MPDVKLQKGCFNFTEAGALDLEKFKEMLRLSAEKDFSPVIAHYKKKK